MSRDPAKVHVEFVQPVTLSAEGLWLFALGLWPIRWVSMEELRERYPEIPTP